MSDALRVITYNIRKGKGASGRQPHDVSELGRHLGSQDVDLLLCQEVFHSRHSVQSRELSRALGMRSYYRPNKHRRVGHHGNATFTRGPVDLFENFDLSTNPVERRGALYLRMQLGQRPLHVFNVHLSLSHRARRKQLSRLRRILAQTTRPDEPVVLAGDFNDWRGRLDEPIVSDLGFTNAFARHGQPTWHAKRPLFNLDRVYLRNLQTRRAERFSGAPWQKLSDHLPLTVEIAAI